MRERKKKRLIIFSMIGLLFIMAAGYAAFQTNLNIKGTSSINSNWDIRITNVTEANKNGEAETVSTNFSDLTAYMEANLYNKGDYIEYDVTIENKGTFDAKLSDIITNVKSNNEAVLITFSGYTKGETLYKETSKIIKVKIEYNPEYEGKATGSGEIEVDFTYDQAEGGTIVPTDKYLVTYDCTTNGGSDCTNYNEYLSEGSSINLTYQGTNKQYYDFVGWNTDKDAHEGLTSLNMGSNDITLYAIYEEIDATAPIIDSVNTTSTTNSITIVVSAHDDESEIVKYEYSIDDGKTWETSESNTYTFTGLTQNTEYEIKVRVTNEGGKVAEGSKITNTSSLEIPTFEEENNASGIKVTITYPEGCGDTLTCSYIKDNGEEVGVTSKSVDVNFETDGAVVAKVSDGTNSVSSSYTVVRYNLYVSSKGSDTTGRGTIEKPYATLQKAYDEASYKANIYVMDNITVNNTTNFNEDKDITLTSYSTNDTINSIIRGNSLTSHIIDQTAGDLTLKNITVNGNDVEAQYPAIILRDNSQNLYIEEGTTIKNCKNMSTTQNEEKSNTGAAVSRRVGNVTMNGGEITNNYAYWGGGMVSKPSDGRMTINNGNITNNEAVYGGALSGGNFTINGGNILNNLSQLGGAITCEGEEIINGGTIANNVAQNAGGAIYITTTDATMTIKNARITGNLTN